MTSFSDLYGFIRALLNDNDSTAYTYSDEVLNSHIRLLINAKDDPNIQEDGSTANFTKDLTAKQKALTTFRVALQIISGTPDEFSYKTPVISVKRKNGILYQRMWLEKSIAEAEGGGIGFSYDSDIDHYVNSATDYFDSLNAALSSRPS